MADLRDKLQEGLAGRYRLERELGRGGMATVFLAHDIRHKRPVALKVLHPELAHSLGPERFQREIETVARLQHPHILTVHDSGEVDGLLWFTMPFVEGESLRDRLRRDKQLPVEDAVRIATDAARALEYAHRHGVIHRDIKPENLLLLSDGSTLVADFGIARVLSGGDATLTETGLVVGTPVYMSPEQGAGERNLDARSDVYSLASVLYEMLAGEPPYTGPSVQAIIAKRFHQPVPKIRDVRPAVPERLEAAVTRALAPVAADRFATAAELERALAGAITGAVPSKHRAMSTRAGRRSWMVAAIAALGLIAVGIGMLRQRGERVGDESGPTRVAVLPFENQGAAADEYFADGMTDAVRGKLTALPALQVTARQSSMEYKRSTKDLREIGRELGVQYLLTATVRWEKRGEQSQVQVNPELVHVSTASTKWQQPFNAAMTSVFEVQGEIAGRVVEALDIALGAKERRALAEQPTRNLPAYDAFLRGEEASQSMGTGDPATLRRAMSFYQAAAVLDSSFALAWARLAVAHSALYLYEAPVPAEAAAAERALARVEALAPDAPETFAARQHYEGWVRLDWARALAAAQAGLARYPANPDLVHAAGLAERSLGRYETALEHFTRARQLDPRSLAVARRRAETLLYLRRWSDTREAVDQVRALAPDDLYTVNLVMLAHLGVGDLDGARRAFAEAPASMDRTALAVMLSLYSDLYWLLDEDAQTAVLAQPPSAFGDYRVAWALVRAQLYGVRGDRRLTAVWADTARQAVLAQLRGVPKDAQLHAFLGLTSAYLGRKAEAIAEGKRATELVPIARDAFNGPYLRHLLARIYLMTGEPELALDELEVLTRIPYLLSPGWLRIDPTFAALREHPRFQRLVSGS